jgi:serine protease Do
MNSSDLNSYLILLSPEGDNIAQDDDSAGEKNSRIEVTLPTDGIYTVLANTYGAGEMGDYRLKISTSGVGPILLKENGTLGPTSQLMQSNGTPYREHRFQGRQGQVITIILESEDFDPFLILVGPDEQVIGQNDDASSGTLNSVLTVTLPVTGTYRIIANSYERTGRGTYVVTVR